MLTHPVTPHDLLMSTVIPIPKNKRKFLNDSENYRGIALSSGLGKLFDWILLLSNKNVLSASDLQFGYKENHSNTHCTFVLNEVVNYYNTHNSDVYVVLLDASKAFDRVNYVKLFQLLLKNGICPVVARFLANLYTEQTVRIKWNDYISDEFSVSNGIKQGRVLSPILFCVYIDELLKRLKESEYGCYIGNTYFGALSYADDVTLLCPTKSGINRMLKIIDNFSKEFDVNFNHTKSKLLILTSNNVSNDRVVDNITFDNQIIDNIEYSKHLGNTIGKHSKKKSISDGICDFYSRVNMLLAFFNFASPWIKYKLFKTYCMPLYGSVLWDLSCTDINKFYTAWR